MLCSYVGYALIYGFFSALMKKPETQDDEYDGAEIKCYGDIPIPYLKINGEPVNYLRYALVGLLMMNIVSVRMDVLINIVVRNVKITESSPWVECLIQIRS